MSSQHSTHGIKRPVQNARLVSNLQSPRLRAQSPSPNPPSPSQDPSASGYWSEENVEDDPDKTTCYTQAPLSPSPGLESSLPAPVLSTAQAPSSATTSNDMPTVPETWLSNLNQEQLKHYVQQQRDLSEQVKRANERLLSSNSAQEQAQLFEVQQDLCRQEQEIRLMLEARQVWDSLMELGKQRLTDLAFVSRQQYHR